MLSMWIDFSRIAPTWRSRETLDRVASSIPSHSSSLTIAKGCSRAKPDRQRLRGLFILSPFEGGGRGSPTSSQDVVLSSESMVATLGIGL
jgi:hypothetical protein